MHDYKLNDSEAAALDAGVATHEGYHVGHGPFGIFGFQSNEHGGYYTQSVTYQGLHNTDRISNLWNESWLTVDKDKLSIERDRERSIEQAVGVANEKKKDNQQ